MTTAQFVPAPAAWPASLQKLERSAQLLQHRFSPQQLVAQGTLFGSASARAACQGLRCVRLRCTLDEHRQERTYMSLTRRSGRVPGAPTLPGRATGAAFQARVTRWPRRYFIHQDRWAGSIAARDCRFTDEGVASKKGTPVDGSKRTKSFVRLSAPFERVAELVGMHGPRVIHFYRQIILPVLSPTFVPYNYDKCSCQTFSVPNILLGSPPPVGFGLASRAEPTLPSPRVDDRAVIECAPRQVVDLCA